jgi:glycosyltransferase involved in cell wall biosynthesis
VTVGYHAPPPGSHTGIADYAETLRRALERTPGYQPRTSNADIDLYHLGNNRLHTEIYRQALEKPGVIVLHDAVLHHFLLGALTHQQYIDEFIYNYGEWRRDFGEELWRERARASVDPRYFQFPMLRRVVERSLAVIVHNPGAAAAAAAAMPAIIPAPAAAARHSFRTPSVSEWASKIAIIPHFCEVIEPPSAGDTAEFRQRLGIPHGARLFGIFGYLREPKRILPCIRAFQKLHALKPHTALLIAGEVVSSDLTRLLDSELPRDPAIHRLGHLSESDFRIAAAAVDCCLNLRYPGAGETSGIAVQLMSLAKPVMVTDSTENADFPPTAVLRISPGVAESEELFDHMVLVAEFPALARDVGIEARRHILRHHALDSVARKYWEVLCTAAALPPS